MNPSENVQKSELLNLPQEILLHILKFVNISPRYDASQVCRKFYELVCRLEKNCLPLELSYDQICDEKIFNSVVNTLREFSNVTINLSVDIVPQIETILMKFGKRIKKCTILRAYGNGAEAKVLESQLGRMLNCIPNVEELTFEDICVERDVHWCDELHLYRLKKLTIGSVYDFPTIFNQVPVDVVTEMCIYFSFHENQKKIQQFINRQTQITKLIMKDHNKGCDLLVLNLSKLEHLTIRCYKGYEMYIAKMILQNPKLRSLDLDIDFEDDEYNDDDSTGKEILSAICELKYLESLNIKIESISLDVFESFTNLINLRELHLKYQYDDIAHFQFRDKLSKLCVMKLLHIEALSIKPSEYMTIYNTRIPQEIIFQFSQNFQNLKHLSFENDSFDIIGTVLKHFIKLETFEFECNNTDEDNFVIDEDIKHENLKEFKVKNIGNHNMKSILNTISACPNLELIEISGIREISHQGLKQILDDHPKLKYLNLGMDDFSFQVVTAELIKSTTLQSISLSGLSQFLSFETIKEFFNEEFSCIKLFKTGWGRWGHFKLVMKKRGPLK